MQESEYIEGNGVKHIFTMNVFLYLQQTFGFIKIV